MYGLFLFVNILLKNLKTQILGATIELFCHEHHTNKKQILGATINEKVLKRFFCVYIKWVMECKYVFDPDGVRKRVQSNDSVTKNHHLLGACSVSMRFGTFFGDLESIWGSKKGGSSMRGDPPSSELDEWGHR